MERDSKTRGPYRGLQPYTEAYREYFFGRDRDKIIICSNLVGSPLTIMYGASGVGKTSVLLAAVLPHLKTISRVTAIPFSNWQQTDFFGDLQSEIRQRVRARTMSLNKGATGGELDPDLTFDELLAMSANRLQSRLLFIFDQFEEYFLRPSGTPEIERFEASLARVINRRDIDAHFLIALREEELSRLDRFQGRIPNLLNNTLRLERLDRNAGREAIVKPLEIYNDKFALTGSERITIHEKLVEDLLDKATERLPATKKDGSAEGVETPVLQLLLTRLWNEEIRQGSRVLRSETLDQQLGGVKRIVSSYVDEVMADLTEPEREIASRIFKYFITATGAKVASDPSTLAGWAGLKGPENQKRVRDLLERLTLQRGADGQSQVPHEKFPILRRIQPDLYELFHDVLGNAIDEWRTDYLQTKLAGAERKKLQFKRGFSLLTFLAVIIAALAAFTSWAAHDAREQRWLTQQRLEEVKKLNDAVKELDSSLPFFQAVMRGHGDVVNSVTFSADGTLLLTASADGTACIWDALTGALVRELRGHTGPVTYASFSADGRQVVTAGADKTARLWDAATGELKKTLKGHEDTVIYAAYTPAGLIITASKDSTVRIWNDQGESIHQLRDHTGPINSAALSTSSQSRLVTASSDGTVRLWDPTTGAALRTFSEGKNVQVNSASFSHDGTMIVSANSDNTASVWRVDDGARMASLRGHLASVRFAAFSNDDYFVVTASVDKTARLWEAESGQPVKTLTGHGDAVNAAAFANADRWLITASDDEVVRLWDVVSGKTLYELRGHSRPVTALDLLGPGFVFATASEDRTARVWNVSKLGSIAQPQLTAEPSIYRGKCPVTIKFTGTITMIGSGGTVKYQFVRSSREKSEERELVFDAPGTQEVRDTWRLGQEGHIYGWETIKILAPQEEESEKAEFTLTCAQPSPSPTPEATPTPRPPLQGVLEGRVVDEVGAPVAGALVSITDERRLPLWSLHTDVFGGFRISNAARNRTLIVTVTKAGYSGTPTPAHADNAVTIRLNRVRPGP
jgi:WD40 repeat protein